MPKQNKRASANAPTAAELIARKRGFGKTPAPAPAALKELAELCAYNDMCAKQAQRVSAADAVTMLRGHGWTGSARTALDTVCREHLGRRSYGAP